MSLTYTIVFLRIFLGIQLSKIDAARWRLEADLGEVVIVVAVWSCLIAWVVGV